MKIVITEEQKKKLFAPLDLDKRAEEYKGIIKKRLDDIRNTPLGKLSKESIFEWIQENNLDQKLKLSYKGPALGEVIGTSYNKSTGQVSLFIYDNTDKKIMIRFKISDIEIGTYDTPDDGDEIFYPLD